MTIDENYRSQLPHRIGNTPLQTINRPYQGDRFIPSRINTAFEARPDDSLTVTQSIYSRLLRNILMPEADGQALVYNAERYRRRTFVSMRIVDQMRTDLNAPAVERRGRFQKAPQKIFDAPYISNDFYFKVIDLFDTTLGIVVDDDVKFCPDVLHPVSNSVPQLNEEERTSLAWLSKEVLMLGATEEDERDQAIIVHYNIEQESLGTLAYLNPFSTITCIQTQNSNTYFVGDQSGRLGFCDKRTQKPEYVRQVASRGLQISSLASRDEHCFASGSNDNTVRIWDQRKTDDPLVSYTHDAAVKGLAFNPVKRNLIASGGGTSDRTIKFVNLSTGLVEQSIDTESQNCGLAWDSNGEILFANQGYSTNSINTYQFEGDRYRLRDQVPNAHDARVLFCANSRPVQDLYITAAPEPDEKLKVWDVSRLCPPKRGKSGSLRKNTNTSLLEAPIIR